LFKLRLTKNVKRMIAKLSQRDWIDAGQGFLAKESEVRLEGWSRQRRAIVLRRRLQGAVALSHGAASGLAQLSFAEIGEATDLYEYSVLITSLEAPVESFGQLYRDRGDGENIFDEMKNPWGWGGFTTKDLARSRLAARLNALSMIGGTSSCVWPIPIRIARRSRAVLCSCPRSPCARATPDKPPSASPVLTPRQSLSPARLKP
jgi:hypothetical protein